MSAFGKRGVLPLIWQQKALRQNLRKLCAANRVYAAREKVFMGFKDGRPAVCIDLQTAGRCMSLQRAPRPVWGAALFSDRDDLKDFVGKKIHDADL